MKDKLKNILEGIGTIVLLAFGFWILSLGFRFIWEALKVVLK